MAENLPKEHDFKWFGNQFSSGRSTPIFFVLREIGGDPTGTKTGIKVFKNLEDYNFTDSLHIHSLSYGVYINLEQTKKLIEKSVEKTDRNFSIANIKAFLEPQVEKLNQTALDKVEKLNQKTSLDNIPEGIKPNGPSLEQANKAGYVQGVCECAAIVSGDKALSSKLLSEMKVTRDMARKYANPETFRELEKTVFAPKVEHRLERGLHR